MQWLKRSGLGLTSSKNRPSGEGESCSPGGRRKSTFRRVTTALKKAFCMTEPAVKGERSTEKALGAAQRAAKSAEIEAEKAQKAAEEAQKEAARETRAQKAEALRLKLQQRRMSKIMDAWSLHVMQTRLNNIRIHMKLFWAHKNVEATRRQQMLREWLKVARQDKPLRPPGPRVPAKDLIIVCGSPLSPIAGARLAPELESQPDTPTRYYTGATHPKDCKTCAACALATEALGAGPLGSSSLWALMGF